MDILKDRIKGKKSYIRYNMDTNIVKVVESKAILLCFMVMSMKWLSQST